MSTLTIVLPDDLAARLEAASEQTHIPPAQRVRAALESRHDFQIMHRSHEPASEVAQASSPASSPGVPRIAACPPRGFTPPGVRACSGTLLQLAAGTDCATRFMGRALPAPAPDWPADRPTLHERMKDFIGCIDSGVPDLATNPKYMEGFGQWRR